VQENQVSTISEKK